MTLETDNVLERRRLRRRVTRWRIAAVAALVIALGVIGYRTASEFGQPHIARINIHGFITNDRLLWDAMEKAGKNDQIKGVILSIDSPGGTVAGSEGLHLTIRKLAAAKPTVAVVDGLAASGGYIAAIGADQIIAREAAIVGSIGVIMQYPNVGKFLDMVGLKMEEVKSSPLKAAPNGYEPTSPEARAALQALVNDSYSWFKTLVKSRRMLDDTQLATASDGRVFSGRSAVGLKLIDQIGHDAEARVWLASKGASAELKVQTLKIDRPTAPGSIFRLSVAALADAAGLQNVSQLLTQSGLEASNGPQAQGGLLALWQPLLP